MKEKIQYYGARIMAGCAISLGAFIYLKVGGPLGAFLFSVGLMSVLVFDFVLFTGKIRMINNIKSDLPWALNILLFNAIGCALIAILATSDYNVVVKCQEIVIKREHMGFVRSIATGIGCGFIMTLAVSAWKESPWPLILGVPAFILAGLTHSVADAFYYCVGWQAITWPAILAYIGTVIGNIIGGLAFIIGSPNRYQR